MTSNQQSERPYGWQDIETDCRMEFATLEELTSFLNWRSGRLEEQHEALLAEWRDYKATTEDVLTGLEEQLKAAHAQLAEIEEQAPPTPEEWHHLNDEYEAATQEIVTLTSGYHMLEEQLQAAESERDRAKQAALETAEALVGLEEQLEVLREERDAAVEEMRQMQMRFDVTGDALLELEKLQEQVNDPGAAGAVTSLVDDQAQQLDARVSAPGVPNPARGADDAVS